MKAVFGCLFSLSIMVGCVTRPVHRTLTPLTDGYYIGSDKLFVIGFVKVNQDKAFADLILNEKFPRDFLADTLAYDGSSHT